MEIVNFMIEDYEAVRAVWLACEGITLYADDDSRESIQAYLERNPGTSFIARDTDRIVGAVLCGHDGRRALLHHLAVHPDCRGRGIGKALVNACLAALRREGIRKCHIFVLDTNVSGKGFWISQGWLPRSGFSVLSRMIEPD